MANDIEDVRSFGRFSAGRSKIHRPTNIADVKRCFEIARETHQRVTIRGGGHSFDAQALHDGDTGRQMIISTEAFDPQRIDFDPKTPDRVTLGCGVRWRHFVTEAIRRAKHKNIPIYLPGSIQTGGDVTVGGTLSADCYSRFSGTMGKESQWIESFRILTPSAEDPLEVSRESDPDLFHAVIGGHGYIGFVTDITYCLTPIDIDDLKQSAYKHVCAHTDTTTCTSLRELIQRQMRLLNCRASYLRGISAEWFGGSTKKPGSIHGAVCESYFAEPSNPKRRGFPLYHKLHSRIRYYAEILVRWRWGDILVSWILYLWAAIFRLFEDPIEDFLFFMDGDTAARKKFESSHKPNLFPIVQQTFVIPVDKTEAFVQDCVRRLEEYKLFPTEQDMVYVLADKCLLSANYYLDGFAVSLGFEQCLGAGPPKRVFELLQELSKDCLKAGGRIHLPKNSHVDKEDFRSMFRGQIERFEQIKRRHDPEFLLQNAFSDRLFDFHQGQRVQAAS